ncbi:hypothetical protein BAL199_27046 [alpha proteobacterium BAL199]|nr:hypothetical protein BAL199_27046 [alpha proteobacterium BAL199]
MTLLAIHYLIASAYDPDETWIEERIADLRGRSYDLDHIQNIEKRIHERDDSVTPPPDREQKPT